MLLKKQMHVLVTLEKQKYKISTCCKVAFLTRSILI